MPTPAFTIYRDRLRTRGLSGLRGLRGYGPQAGSPFPAPWSPIAAATPPPAGSSISAPLATMNHDQEQQALTMVKHQLATSAASAKTAKHPAVAGLVRGVQSRAAQLAASQGGSLTPVQREQLASVNRQIRTAIRRAHLAGLGRYVAADFVLPAPVAGGLGDYVAGDFVIPSPVDDGTSVLEVASNNFPLLTGAPAPGQDTGQPPAIPAAAPAGPSPLVLLAIAAGLYWYFDRKG